MGCDNYMKTAVSQCVYIAICVLSFLMNVCTMSQVPFCEYNVYLSTIVLSTITMCLCIGRAPGDPSYYVEDGDLPCTPQVPYE